MRRQRVKKEQEKKSKKKEGENVKKDEVGDGKEKVILYNWNSVSFLSQWDNNRDTT